MKVLLVNGSSHLHGSTMRALEEMIGVLKAEGVDAEVVQLGGAPLADCLQCERCREAGKCVIGADRLNEFVEKAASCDGFVFGSPVYYAHPSGRILTFLDRAFYSCGGAPFRHKPGAAVAVARRGGASASFDVLNKYFGLSQMPVAGSTYWNITHALTAEDVPHDEEGLQTLRNLARNLVWMMRCFAAGRDAGISPPQAESGACTNFIDRGGRPYPEG